MKSPQPIDATGAHPSGIHCVGWGRLTALGRRGWMIALSVALLSVVAALAAVQDPRSDEEEEDVPEQAAVAVELMDREPFYQLTLDAEDNNAVIEILPLESVPLDPQPTDRLRVRLVNNPEQEYEVTWEHIAKLRTYHQLVFEEAVRLVQAKRSTTRPSATSTTCSRTPRPRPA